MKNQIVSVVSLVVAVTALVVAANSRRDAEAPATTTASASAQNIAAQSPVREVDREAGNRADLEAKIFALNARLDAIERETRSADQIQLLTNINASLELTASNALKNTQDLQALRTSTQEAFNVIGPALAKLNADLAKMREGK